MIEHVKQLIVVLIIASTIFVLAKPIALRFSSESDFSRRRNVWFILTIAAFLSPSFWLYALIAIPLFTWAGRKDSNPVALYLLLLYVTPDVPVEIPAVGVQEFFALNNERLLSFCILIPTAMSFRRSKDGNPKPHLTSMDFLLIGYGLLQTLLYIPPDLPNHVLMPDSTTNLLRRGFLFFIDIYVLYYVVSRFCSTRRTVVEAQSAFCLVCGVMAAVSVFEGLRNWLLYTDIAAQWSNNGYFHFYDLRGGTVRAQASAGHPIALGTMLAVATGFWLYLQSKLTPTRWHVAITLLLWAGLLATFARGPWVGAVAIYLAYVAFGPRALSRSLKAATIIAIVVFVMSLTPFGEKIINSLPFLGGTADHNTVDYRESLAKLSWQLLQQHPFFGDQLALTKMEGLRQGQGIIDFVNTYAQVGLDYGLVGLSMLIGLSLIGLVKSYALAKRTVKSDPDLALLGASLGACTIGIFLMIASSSFILGVEKLYYILAALAAAYLRLHKFPDSHSPTLAVRDGLQRPP